MLITELGECLSLGLLEGNQESGHNLLLRNLKTPTAQFDLL